MVRSALCLVALALLCAGCSGPAAAPQTPATAAAKGELAVGDLRIVPPPGWVAVNLTADKLDAELSKAAKQQGWDSKYADVVRQAAASGVVKLLVFDTAQSGKPFVRNLNVVVIPVAAPSIADEVKMSKEQMTTMAPGTKIITATTTKLPAGEAGHIVAHMQSTAVTYATCAYMLHHGGNAYTFTFSSSLEDEAATQKLAEESIKTVRFVK